MIKLNKKTIIIILGFLFAPSFSFAANWYVALDGDNSNGNSLATAWNEVNQITWASISAGDTIYIKAGTYRTTLYINKNGTAGNNINILPYPGDEGNVIITGSDVVGSWTQCESAEACGGNPNYANIYSVDINYSPKQLFQDGTLLKPSRYPNTGWEYMTGVNTGSRKRIFYDTSLAKSDDYFNGSTAHIKLYYYDLGHVEVEDYKASTGEVTLTASTTTNIPFDLTDTYDGYFGYFFTNIASDINAEGEWAYSSATGKVYLWPVGGTTDGVEASNRDYGISGKWGLYYVNVDGIITKNHNLSGVYFEGIYNSTFQNISSLYNFKYGLGFQTGESLQVLDNTSNFNSDSGIYIRDIGSLTLDGNIITSSGGVTQLGDDLISGNGNGIILRSIGSGQNITVTNNRIDKSGYNGILILGQQYRNRTIQNNYITNSLLSLDDGGAIYSSPDNDTNRVGYDYIRNNIIKDVWGYFGGTPREGQDITAGS